MWEVARRLAARGDEVALFCSSFPGASRREEREGVQIYRLGDLFTTAPRAFFRYRLGWRHWPDVVVEEALGGLRVPYAAPAYVSVPTVAFWYQTHRRVFEHQFGPRVAWGLDVVERGLAAFHRDAFVLSCSTTSKENLVAMGFSPERIEVYYPGPSASLLRAAGEAALSRREPLIATIGKIRRYKSYHHGIYVLERLRRQVPDARLVIAGRREDTHYERRMASLARDLGVQDAVSFELDISEERKAELLRQAKALLITSPIEGFGLTAIEANLFGTPVVASNGVADEAVLDGVTGFRVPFGDLDAYADAIRSVLTDDTRFLRLSTACIEYARGFTWERAMGPIFRTIDRAARSVKP